MNSCERLPEQSKVPERPARDRGTEPFQVGALGPRTNNRSLSMNMPVAPPSSDKTTRNTEIVVAAVAFLYECWLLE